MASLSSCCKLPGSLLPGSQPDLVSSCRLHAAPPGRRRRSRDPLGDEDVSGDAAVAGGGRASYAPTKVTRSVSRGVSRVGDSGPTDRSGSLLPNPLPVLAGGGTSNPAFHGPADIGSGGGGSSSAADDEVNATSAAEVVAAASVGDGSSRGKSRRSADPLDSSPPPGGSGSRSSISRVPVWPEPQLRDTCEPDSCSSSCHQAGVQTDIKDATAVPMYSTGG